MFGHAASKYLGIAGLVRGLVCWTFLPAMMILTPSVVLLLMLGAIGLLAKWQAAMLERIVMRDEPLSLSSRPFIHNLLAESSGISDSVLSPPMDLWGQSLAAVRFDWPRTATIGGALTGAFCVAALLYLRWRLHSLGFRGDSRLPWREEIWLQFRMWPAGMAACRAIAPIAALIVPVWFLLPCVFEGLLWQSAHRHMVLGVVTRCDLYILVTVGAPFFALLVAAVAVTRRGNALAMHRGRSSGPLCRRCGYPLAGKSARCSECGGSGCRNIARPRRLGCRRTRRRALGFTWVVAVIGTCALLAGGRRMCLDLGLFLQGHRSLTSSGPEMLVYLRSDEPYVLLLEGRTILLRASVLRFGGGRIVAACRDDPTGEIWVEHAAISEEDRAVPTMFTAPPSMEFGSVRAEFKPPMFFADHMWRGDWVLMTLTRRSAVASIRQWRHLGSAEQAELATLKSALGSE